MADKKLPVSVVITAVDNVTYKVMAINEKLKRITAPVSDNVGKIGGAFSALGSESGLTGLAKNLGKIGSTGKEFIGEVAGALAKMTGVAVAAGTAIYGITHSFAEAGDDVNTFAKRLGLTTDQFQELQYAANKAQVGPEEFVNAMGKFSKGIGEAAAGTGEALIGFNALGINVRDNVTKKVRTLGDLLPVVADKLGAIHNQNIRNALAAKIFGREGAKLNEIFNEGSAGLSKLREEARQVGAVMTPEQIKAATEFDDGLKSVTATLMMVRNVVGAALAPALIKMGMALQKYILDHQEDIKKFADQFAQNLPGYIDQITTLLRNLGTVLSPVVSLVSVLADAFGAVNVAFAGMLAWFGGGAITSFFSFIKAIGGALPSAARFAWVAITMLWDALVGIGTALAAIFGWPVVIVAALGGAAVLLYKKWQPFADLIDRIWGTMKGFAISIFGGSTPSGPDASYGPQMAPSLDFLKPVDAAARNSSSKNENHVLVDFNNLPQGTRVETKKADSSLDLSMGYSMAD